VNQFSATRKLVIGELSLLFAGRIIRNRSRSKFAERSASLSAYAEGSPKRAFHVWRAEAVGSPDTADLKVRTT
jgi:hypothetical protein